MSANIKTSLNKLNNAVIKLEQAIEAKKAAPKKPAATTQTPDLFNASPSAPGFPAMNPQNVRMLATRLDNAIDQVEKILKEGRG